MYGERDKTPYKEESMYWMENIPDHTNVMVAKAEHAAFVGNPAGFHSDILRFLSAQCQIGEDTIDVYDSDSDSDRFGDYERETDSDTAYYNALEDNVNVKDYEEYLVNYFADNDGQFEPDYYDETELYFDNKDVTEDEIINGYDNENVDTDGYAGIGEDTQQIDADTDTKGDAEEEEEGEGES